MGVKGSAMSHVRFRGFLGVLAGLALLAPGFGYLLMVDYRRAAFPPWGTSLAVAFLAPSFWLLVCGLYSLISGKVMPRSPIRLKL
jgi:hypothetical protein